MKTDKEIVEEFVERASHTLKLVPQSQRELFVSEIEGHLLTTLKAAREEGRESVVEEIEEFCKTNIDLLSQGTNKTPLALGGRSYSDYEVTGRIISYEHALMKLSHLKTVTKEDNPNQLLDN